MKYWKESGDTFHFFPLLDIYLQKCKVSIPSWHRIHLRRSEEVTRSGNVAVSVIRYQCYTCAHLSVYSYQNALLVIIPMPMPVSLSCSFYLYDIGINFARPFVTMFFYTWDTRFLRFLEYLGSQRRRIFY